MQFVRLLTMLMLSFTIVACEGSDDDNTGVNNEQPGKLPNVDIDGTPDDDMGKPNEDHDSEA